MPQPVKRHPADKKWLADCEAILLECGAVQAERPLPKHHKARYRARRLIALLVEDRGYRRKALAEHTERSPATGEWTWLVELTDPSVIEAHQRQAARDSPRV